MNTSPEIGKAPHLVPSEGQTDAIDVHAMSWQALGPNTRCKVLYRDEKTGVSVVLFDFAPGALRSPLATNDLPDERYGR